MADLPSLHDLQLRLRELIAHPVASSEELDRELDAALADLPIAGDATLSAGQRVRIYAGMYFLRLRDALAEDYVALRRSLGTPGFEGVVRAYVARYPSDRVSLRDLGRHLPTFLADHPELLEEPWQADLARFEWAMVEAFDAPDEPTLHASDLEALPSEAWPGLRLVPVRSLVLLAPNAPVDTLRERILAEEQIADVVVEPLRLRVWRQEFTVFHRRMDASENDALERLREGATFAELCEWLADRNGPDDDAAEQALGMLARWLEDDLLVKTADLPMPESTGT